MQPCGGTLFKHTPPPSFTSSLGAAVLPTGPGAVRRPRAQGHPPGARQAGGCVRGHGRACRGPPTPRRLTITGRPKGRYPPPPPRGRSPHVNRKPHAADCKHRPRPPSASPPAHVTRPAPTPPRPRRPLIGGSGVVDHIRSGTTKPPPAVGRLGASLKARPAPGGRSANKAVPAGSCSPGSAEAAGRRSERELHLPAGPAASPLSRLSPPRPWRPSAGLAGRRESVPSKHWREPRRLRHGGGAVRALWGGGRRRRRAGRGGGGGSGPWTSSSTR